MRRLFLLVVLSLVLSPIYSQNLMNVAFDTNGPVGKCLFPQNESGEIIFTGVVECEFSADTIIGLAREFIHSISKRYKADISSELEGGITKVACDVELKVGKKYISIGVWAPDNIGTWEKAASTVKFGLLIEVRNKKYRYTLTNFVTDRYRIPGEGKDQGPSNMIHWQRVNSLTKEKNHARSKEQNRFQALIDFENALYEAEYNAVQDVINGVKSFARIEDDF